MESLYITAHLSIEIILSNEIILPNEIILTNEIILSNKIIFSNEIIEPGRLVRVFILRIKTEDQSSCVPETPVLTPTYPWVRSFSFPGSSPVCPGAFE